MSDLLKLILVAANIIVLVIVIFLYFMSPPADVSVPSGASAVTSSVEPNPGDPRSSMDLASQSAVLMDARTGLVLYAKEPNQAYFPASITKIATTAIALRRADLMDRVVISERAAAEGGSSIYLEAGQVWTLKDLLYGIMLESGNDAAVAVAEHIAGSIEEFALLMNQFARDAGAKNTHFANPNGMPDEEHFTTALDMAKITRLALQTPKFQQIASTKTYSAPHPGTRDGTIYMENHNKLLGESNIDGGKTGFTKSARHTFVATATKGQRKLIVTLLRSTKPGFYQDTEKLLQYGFEGFIWKRVVENGEAFNVPVRGGKQNAVTAAATENVEIPLTEKGIIKKTISYEQPIKAPVTAGETIAVLNIFLNDRHLTTTPLVSQNSIARSVPRDLLHRLDRWVDPQ